MGQDSATAAAAAAEPEEEEDMAATTEVPEGGEAEGSDEANNEDEPASGDVKRQKKRPTISIAKCKRFMKRPAGASSVASAKPVATTNLRQFLAGPPDFGGHIGDMQVG